MSSVARIDSSSDATYDATTLQHKLATQVAEDDTVTCTLACDSQSTTDTILYRTGSPFDSQSSSGVGSIDACPVSATYTNNAGDGSKDLYVVGYANDAAGLKDACIKSCSGNSCPLTAADCPAPAPAPAPGPGSDHDDCNSAVRAFRYIRDITISLFNGLIGAASEGDADGNVV